jgi:hypothetical protein
MDELDLKAGTNPLNATDMEAKKGADRELAKLRHDEESMWAQCAKVKHILEGGNKTKYFHLIAGWKT